MLLVIFWSTSTLSPITELGDISLVLHEYDTVLYKNAVPDNLLGLVDASSLLWRLNVMGIDVGEMRWEKVINGFSTFTDHHTDSWLVGEVMQNVCKIRMSLPPPGMLHMQ